MNHPYRLIITVPADILANANAAAVTVLGPGNDTTFRRWYHLADDEAKEPVGYMCTIPVTTTQLLALRAELMAHPELYQGLCFYRLQNVYNLYEASNLINLPYPFVLGEEIGKEDVLAISGPNGEPCDLYNPPMQM